MRYARILALLTMVVLSGCFEKAPEGFATDQPVRVGHQRLAIGVSATVGVKDDGTVWSWGSSSVGELGRGELSVHNVAPQKIPGLEGIVEVSGQDSHFLALSSDGDVYSWGNNDHGQLGYVTHYKFQVVPQKVEGLENIISVSAGFEHSIALDRDGNVWGLGSTTSSFMAGQSSVVSDGQSESVRPVKLGSISGAVRVNAGTTMNAVLTRDGQVWVMGGNNRGELGCATTEGRLLEFVRCQGVSASDFATGVATFFILDRRGFVWASGANYNGQLGRGSTDHNRNIPLEKVHGLAKVIGVASNGTGVCALDSDGHVWVWGESAGGPPPPAGFGATRDWDTPHDIAEVLGAFEIFGGPAAQAVALNDGSIRFLGSAAGGIRGASELVVDSTKTWLTPQQSLWKWKAD